MISEGCATLQCCERKSQRLRIGDCPMLSTLPECQYLLMQEMFFLSCTPVYPVSTSIICVDYDLQCSHCDT